MQACQPHRGSLEPVRPVPLAEQWLCQLLQVRKCLRIAAHHMRMRNLQCRGDRGPSKTSSRIALLERESDVATANIKKLERDLAERDERLAELSFLLLYTESRIPRLRFTDWVTFTDGFRITYAVGQPVMMFTPLLDKVSADEEHMRVPAFKGPITVMRDLVGSGGTKLRIERAFGKPRPGVTTVGEFFQAIADWHDATLSDSDRVTLGPHWERPFTSGDDVQRPGAQAHVLRRHEGAGAGHIPATPDRVI